MTASPKPAQVLADVQQKLAAHPFVVLLLDHMRSALAPHQAEIKKRVATRTAGKKVTDPLPIEGADAYAMNTLDAVTKIVNAGGRLPLALYLMHRYPSRPNIRRDEVREDAWVQYHYGSYIVQASGIGDVSLLATAQVFLLGLQPQQVGRETVMRNDWVDAQPKVREPLKQIWALADRYRSERNRHVHRGEAPTIEEISSLLPHSIVESAGVDPILPPKLLRAAYRLAVQKVLGRMYPDVQAFTEAISALLDGLRPQYEKRRRGFQSGFYSSVF